MADMRIDMTRRVYEIDAEDLLDLIHGTLDEHEPGTLAVIGHNPAMEELSMLLAGPGSDEDARERMRTKFPTASVAVFDGQWDDFGPGRMALEHFITPRELPEA